MDSHIRNIRAKLAASGCRDGVETVHGVGFRLGPCGGDALMSAVWREGRPSLGLVLALVLGTVLALPLAGVLASGVYDDGLLRRTEAELLAQSAALAADAGRTIDESLPAGVPLGAPLPEGPSMDLAADLGHLRPPRPEAVQPAAAPDAAFRALGERLAPDLAATQAATLAGFRLLDPSGTVIAGRGEVGLSLAGVEEVAAALRGRTAAALRRRVSKHRYPALGSLSRGRPVRVFVAVPVVVRGRVAGVVFASRTPVDLLGSLYGQREALGLAARRRGGGGACGGAGAPSRHQPAGARADRSHRRDRRPGWGRHGVASPPRHG